MVEVPQVLAVLFAFLALPKPGPIPVMHLEYQVSQKLHGLSAPFSKRVHDLIDLQLIMSNGDLDLGLVGNICQRLFKYRKMQTWPPTIVMGEGWGTAYNEQKGDLPVLPTIEEAVDWANKLVKTIDKT